MWLPKGSVSKQSHSAVSKGLMKHHLQMNYLPVLLFVTNVFLTTEVSLNIATPLENSPYSEEEGRVP